MRTGTPRQHRQAGPRSQAATSLRRGAGDNHRAFHLLTALLLMLGLFAPYSPSLAAPAGPSAQDLARAQQGQTTPTYPAPTQVVVAGNFQAALGCPQDFDKTCQITALEDIDGDGIWVGAFPVPVGQWLFRVVTSSDIDRSLGQDGDPDGPEINLQVPDGTTSVFFIYNHHTLEIAATPVAQVLSLATDLGNFVLLPGDNNSVETYFDSPGGTFNVQLLVDGQPVSEPTPLTLNTGLAHVVVDGTGSVTTEVLPPATLTVSKVDAAGVAVPDGCFQLLDTQNQLVNQGCDGDDNNPDGSITLTFPTGFVPGGYTLIESVTGGEAATESQQIQLQEGDNVAQLTVAGDDTAFAEPTVPGEPTEVTVDPGVIPAESGVDVSLSSVDANSLSGLPGACFALDGGEPTCDDDGDGVTTLSGVEPGSHTLSEPVPPSGYAAFPDTPITVGTSGDQFQVPHQLDAAPAETPEPADTGGELGVLVLNTSDAQGEPLTGACYTVTQTSGIYGPFCDNTFDGFDDGRLEIPQVTPGEQILEQVTPPQGVTGTSESQTVQLGSAETLEVDFVNQTADAEPTETSTATATAEAMQAPEESPGDLVVLRQDSEGNAVGGGCFTLFDANGQPVGEEVCDEDGDLPDDGRIGLLGVPAGGYTLRETRTPEGFEAAGETTVQVLAGVAIEQPVSGAEIVVEEPVEAEETGSLLIIKQDGEGAPLGGSCFELASSAGSGAIVSTEQPQSACDNQSGDGDPAEGRILIADQLAGDYTLRESQTPDGYQTAADRPVSIASGETVEETVSNEADVPDFGTITITTITGEANRPLTGACYSVTIENGATFGPFCDAQFDGVEDGLLTIPQVELGNWNVSQTVTPDGFETPADQQTTVTGGEDSPLSFSNVEVPAEPGALAIARVDAEGEIAAGACVEVSGPETDTQVCDNGENDADPEPGQTLVEELAAGDYTVAEVQAPEGFEIAAAQSVTVAEGDTTELTTESEAIAPATGTIQINATGAETGGAATGACWLLNGPASYGPLCDDGANGGTADDGTVTFEEILAGDYTLSEQTPPSGYEAVGVQTIAVVEGDNAPVVVPHTAIPPTAVPPTAIPPTAIPPAPGGVEVTTTDPTGNLLPGACYSLDGGDEVCDDDGDGITVFAESAAGTYTLTQTVSFEEFQTASEQSITVVAGEVLPVTVINQPPPSGAVVISKRDGADAALGGACFSIDGVEVCDNSESDPDPAVGEVRFDALTPGDHEVSESQTPEGYLTAPAQTVTVGAGTDTPVTFVNQTAPPATGAVAMTLQDAEGAAVPGACVNLSNDGENVALGPFCDNGADDNDPAAGLLLLNEVPTGVYSVTTSAESGEFAAADTRTIVVLANVTVQIIIIIIIQQPDAEGDVLITKRVAGTSQRLAGACFQLTNAANTYDICDEDGVDGDGTVGQVRFNDIPAGEYTLIETEPPVGYGVAADQNVTVTASGTARVTVQDAPLPPQGGDLVVLKVDQGGDAVGGACFSLLSGTTVVSGPVCDEDGDLPDDGRIGFFDVPTGSYTLRETRRPSNDYFQADDRTITIVAGDTVTVQVENVLRPGRIVIRKVDVRDGSALAGACFSLDGPSGAYDFCDSDETGNDGLIRFGGIAAGDYTLSETLAPDGFQIGPNVTVTIRPGRTTLLTIQNQPMPPPAQVGNLTVIKVNQGGSALAGACFSLRQGAVTIVGSRCDSGDGASDGVIRFTGVGVGAYQLHETQRPSAAYEAVADVSVTITQNQTTEVRVENRLKPGRILIIKTDAYGNRLQNACFDVVGESGPAACTNANGELFFENIAQGTYSLTETQAPAGYVPAADRTGIVVNAGTTTVITIQNQRVPPPANTGTVQIFKFTCPAGAAGEYTQFIDSSNPGPSRLAQTAGCVAANAEFTMIRSSGEGGPGAFATGGDGFYQTNVQNGTYTLTETNPDLPGESSEAVTIYTNQLTTVVVLNFIAPPAPAPVTINVAKYTCLPGYAGSIYGDFVANCASDETLTNNITFRTSGAVASKRITGDGGQKGRTSFGQIPAGQYTLSEETPFGTATVYAFCGTDPNAPNIKYVGGTIGFSITAGQTVHCTFFNVPPDLTPTTGTILVHKLVCATTTPPPGYDWYNECAPQSTGVGFSIALYSGETKTYAPVTTATTDIDGLVRFSLLQPGQYQLKEIGGEWCHAESNSVDPKGDVIVRAQTLSEVWIFNCVITKAGPNTGTGSAAGLLTPGGAGGDGLALALSLLWPAMGLALYGLYRGRSGRRMARLTTR